jgi:hypothetical protein
MRIADYAAIDLYLWSTSSARGVLAALASRSDVAHLLKERRERAERDKRRYWRVAAGEGQELVLYLDLLPPLVEKAGPDALKDFIEAHGELMLATLALVPAVVV